MHKLKPLAPFIITAIVMAAGALYTLPYYISKPGMAKELEPIIEVEDGYDEEGTFMLTTVRMGKANIYSYLAAKASKYQVIYPEEDILGKVESESDYNTKQLHMMESSKQSAIEVAYKKAGIPIDYRYKGVYVMTIMADMPAEGNLKTGDRLIKVDDLKMKSTPEFIDYVSNKKAGDEIVLTFLREGKKKTATLPLKPFKGEPNKAGIGIELADDLDIIVDPKVKVNTDEIGGPSAGLMFTLEIYNQLTESDLTRGYEIAGTGTITGEGIVGPIGGIEQKIIAADKAGADIFFAPNEKGAKNSNYNSALKTAKDIDTSMKIIPVDTFEEAVAYLEKLHPEK